MKQVFIAALLAGGLFSACNNGTNDRSPDDTTRMQRDTMRIMPLDTVRIDTLQNDTSRRDTAGMKINTSGNR
ncbi:MAG TPA: hypothetical protein VIK74_11810 [Parasegetibacter sp.]|jgi:hypothetical protein